MTSDGGAPTDRRYDPKLNKKRYLSHADCAIYTVQRPGLTDEAVYEFVNAHYRHAGKTKSV